MSYRCKLENFYYEILDKRNLSSENNLLYHHLLIQFERDIVHQLQLKHLAVNQQINQLLCNSPKMDTYVYDFYIHKKKRINGFFISI
jgi:hypothetical protein